MAVENLSATTGICWRTSGENHQQSSFSNLRSLFNTEDIDEEEEEEEEDISGTNNDNDDAQYDDSIDLGNRVRNPS